VPPTTFLVTLHRSGPQWIGGQPAEGQSRWPEHADYMDALVASGRVLLGGPAGDDGTVVLAIAAESEQSVRAILADDPWIDSHLIVRAVVPWTIRLHTPGIYG
jgi:uncharacterized protein YciI